jgi:murein L,D-transpeptidase YafK
LIDRVIVVFRGLGFGLLTAVALAHAALPARAQSLAIELKDVAPDRVERQRAEALGALPLPGTPDLNNLKARLEGAGVKSGDPLFIRVFKAESELELWARKGDGFVLLATYPVCHWSGTLGPKQLSGDKQTPEGFYTVTRRQLHRSARHPQALNLGFPNVLDAEMGRTGSYLLVHGGCSSVGCFAMTNAVMAEIFELTEAAFRSGQAHLPVHVFPFRMTEANMAHYAGGEWQAFWSNLREGYEAFERTRVPPRINVCDKRYIVQELSAAEVGSATGPLAPCGDTLAAIQALAMLKHHARSRASSQPAALLALPQSPTRHADASVTPMTMSGRSSLGGPDLPQPACHPGRPSCRKWIDLRLKTSRAAKVRAAGVAQRIKR